MDLQKFVTTALVQIVNGARDAQDQLKSTGARINPGLWDPMRDSQQTVVHPNGWRTYAKDVQFDVAVTATDEKSAEGGAGLRVWGTGIGAEGKVTSENSTVSRVQFAIPVSLPIAPDAEK